MLQKISEAFVVGTRQVAATNMFISVWDVLGECKLLVVVNSIFKLLPLLGLTVDGKARGKPLHLATHLEIDKIHDQKLRERNFVGIEKNQRQEHLKGVGVGVKG